MYLTSVELLSQKCQCGKSKAFKTRCFEDEDNPGMIDRCWKFLRHRQPCACIVSIFVDVCARLCMSAQFRDASLCFSEVVALLVNAHPTRSRNPQRFECCGFVQGILSIKGSTAEGLGSPSIRPRSQILPLEPKPPPRSLISPPKRLLEASVPRLVEDPWRGPFGSLFLFPMRQCVSRRLLRLPSHGTERTESETARTQP